MAFAESIRSIGRAGLFSLSVLRASKPTADFFASWCADLRSAALAADHRGRRPASACR